MNRIAERLNHHSTLRKNKYLYIHAIIMTLLLVLNLFPIPNTPLANGLQAVYVLICFVSTIVALFALTGKYTQVLRFEGGLVRPQKKWSRRLAGGLIVLFFVWVDNFANIFTSLTNPAMLNSSTYPTENIWFDIYTFVTAGPLEETWRWTFIIATYYLGVRVLGEPRQKPVFWICVGISAALFGSGHVGEFAGHAFGTWFLLSMIGLLLFFVAYWSRSFWIAVATHSVYDLLVSFHWFEYWFIAMTIPWFVIAFFYYRWRRHFLAATNDKLRHCITFSTKNPLTGDNAHDNIGS